MSHDSNHWRELVLALALVAVVALGIAGLVLSPEPTREPAPVIGDGLWLEP